MPADFIDLFLEWTEYAPSPYIFRLWSAIGCIAGALERRVWVKAIQRPTYPNLYTLLVASPGIGKSVIDDAGYLWKKVKKFKTAPDSVTSASLVQALSVAKRVIMVNNVPEIEYHSLLVAAEEFSFLMPNYDPETAARFIKIFNNPPEIRIARIYMDEELNILKPQLNILAGAQPGFLASMLPDEAWKQGFTQRLIMIYSGTGKKVPLFHVVPERGKQDQELTKAMFEFGDLIGEFTWSGEAMRAIEQWDTAGGPPIPQHPRLTDYLNRRTQFMMKLMMISAASRREGLSINLFDFDRALAWIVGAESVMPDVFREMHMRSDKHLLEELQAHGLQIYLKRGKKPMHMEVFLAFLESRIPKEKVWTYFQLAVRMRFIYKVGEELYIPRTTGDAEIDDLPKG